ncbi:MAG: TonB-dependent receptor [Gemmatimonadaceae bacterium]|nr:TonB-dependent receptor [Gemmatimonadaceae bacterium]MDQ3517585.1 TonB-dependent receptor [Gemmatimonadota bacterium]
MTTVSILAEKARTAAAALVLVTGVAQQLSAQEAAVITGTVRNAVTGGPVANATVRVIAGRRFSVTGGDGGYRLVVDAGQSEVRVTAIGFAPASQMVSLLPGASAVTAFALQPSAVPLDEVVAVGTRALERTATGSPVPVDVISSQLLDNTGMTETWQQLQRLVPSVNVPHIPIGDNHMRPVTLRGLAPHHVLVLVDGKRRHPASVLLAGPSVPATALTDLNAIPSGAIERIEVLRDGAAAQYGSDAIGGVVNVVLKSGEHRDLQTSIGGVYSSEGGRDFRDGALFEASTTLGFVSANGGHLTLTGELRDRSGTNRAYPDMRPQYFAGDPRNDEPPRVSSYLGNGAVHALTFFLTAAAPVTRSTEAYAFGGAADRHSVSHDAFFRRPLDSRTVRAIYPDGFLPRIGSQIRDLSVVGGMRGTLRGWRWDLSSGWGGNGTAYHVHNSNNVSLGSASPTEFYAGRVAAQQWTSNADVTRDLKLGSFAVGVAGGAELRVEKYQIRAGEPDSWRDGGVRILDGPQAGQSTQVGAQGMFGFRPTDEVSARRSSSALYLEAEGRPIQRLLLQSAARAEHYSDFGSTSDGKVAARMQLLPGLALRGSMSTGFRAPALTQKYFSSTRTVFQTVNGVTTVLTVRTFPVNTPEAQLMGATPLRPEKSVSRSAGLVLHVPRLPQITADLYRIAIGDRVGLLGSITDTSIIRLFEENGMRGIGGGNYFTNSIDTRTQGVDLVASHALLLNGSRVLRMLGGYNHTRSIVTRVSPPPPQLARFQSELFSRSNRGIVENGQPRETITLTLSYGAGPLAINLHNQRSGPTAQLDQNTPEADQTVGPKWITDVRISYQLRPRVQVALSAANLFDVYPEEWWDFKDGLNAQGVSMQGIFRYPGALSPFGMNGRTLYLRLAYH